MLSKRILILQQTNARFAQRHKRLCGMVKLVNDDEQTVATIFVANADTVALGEWWLLLQCGKQTFANQLSSLNSSQLTLPRCALEDVACLLVKREETCYEVARACVGNADCDLLSRQTLLLVNRANATQSSQQTSTNYEQFVASTDNYYPQVDVDKLRQTAQERYKSVRDYSVAFERYYATGAGSNYYQSVKEEICKVFVKFPPYYPLVRKYQQCFFVRIDFPSSDKFFVLGLLQKQGEVRYICYGLPAEQSDVKDKDFVLVENAPVSFWMLFQDAQTGQITVLQDV